MSLFSNPGFGDGRSSTPPQPQKSLRLAAHTRAGYEQALAAALTEGTAASAATLDAVTVAAAGYSESQEGAERVQRDIASAEAAHAWERAAALRSGYSKGQSAKEASQVARQASAVKPDPHRNGVRQTVLGQRAMRTWDPEEPIWPKREDLDAIIAITKIPSIHSRLGAKAFRSIYSQVWRSCFYPDRAGGVVVMPYSDEEGWSWRRFAIASTERQFLGAEILTPADLTPGMTIHNGFGIRTVRGTEKTGTTQMARDTGVVTVDTYRITYTDGNSDKVVSGDQPLVHLPAIDVPDPSNSRTGQRTGGQGSNGQGSTGSSSAGQGSQEKNKPLDFG